MAIDTASKRFSMVNFGHVPVTPLIIPDGTVGAGDQYHLLNLYFGITLDAPPAAPIGERYVGFIRNVNRMGRLN